MDQPMNTLAFRAMALAFKLRDRITPRSKVLDEADLEPGDEVLDFGCGPGSYVPETSRRVGPGGRVYALDLHPLALRTVSAEAGKEGLSNVSTIQSDCETGLADQTIDVVLLHDTFHLLSSPQEVLAELHRVLKPEGHLSFSDHHMHSDDIVAGMTRGGLFSLEHQGSRTYSFVKNGRPAAGPRD